MADTFTAAGKQILRNGEHFADAINELAASEIVSAFQSRASIADYLDREGTNKHRTLYFRRLLRVLADNVRTRIDIEQVAPEGERARYNEETRVG